MWLSNPCTLSRGQYVDDCLLFNSRLREHEQRLFSDENPLVELFLLQRTNAHRTIFRQTCTWGRFNVSAEMFNRIMKRLDVFPPFLDFVLAFGFKLEAKDEDYGGLHRRVYRRTNTSSNREQNSFEIAYNLRYAEKHGRNLKDPWSLRHMAVYQRYNAINGSSSWIILQPSGASYRQLQEILNDSKFPEISEQVPLLPQSAFLWSCERNWREYINYLEREFSNLEEKAMLSRVGRQHQVDYAVAFADTQALLGLCKKMRRCRAILDTAIEIASGHEALWQELGLSTSTPLTDILDLSHLEMFKSSIRNHQRNVANLLDSASGISQILFQILAYRNDEILIRSSHALHHTSSSLQTIATAAQDENRTAALTTRKDSQVIKTLTFVAMLYLPASLMAEIFNSGLIQFQSTDGEDGPAAQHQPSLHVTKAFWLYPVLTIALLAITFIIMMTWMRCVAMRR